jgi:hypothetical protein
MDDQRTDRESGAGVKESHRFIRVLFWGAVIAVLLAVVQAIVSENNRAVAVYSTLAAIALIQALWMEWRIATKK